MIPKHYNSATSRFATISILSMLLIPAIAFSATGVIVYESRGLDTRRTQTGHAALVLTQVCADGLTSVRPCLSSELPGVVVTRYTNLAWGSPIEFIVLPLRDHFLGTDDPDKLPLLTTGPVLREMQMQYWRNHWKDAIPPMETDEYERHRKELNHMTMVKALKYVGQFEFLMKLLAPSKKSEPTAPIALRDPVSGVLIRDGRWRTALGVQHERDSYVFLTPTEDEQELSLVEFLKDERKARFNLLASNCSDFVGHAFSYIFRAEKFHRRPRALAFGDSFISSPVSLATDFVRFANDRKMPLAVYFVPQLAGSRAKSTGSRTTVAGCLNPSFRQGLVAFGIKAYLLQMNFLVPTLAFAADRLAFNINIDKEATAQALPVSELLGGSPQPEFFRVPTRLQQTSYYGTKQCWQSRRTEFKVMVNFSVERGLIPAESVNRSNTFFWPANLAQDLEKRGLLNPDQVLQINRGWIAQLSADGPIPASDLPLLTRYLILAINFDLRQDALDRRSAPEFDKDWLLLNRALRQIGYNGVPPQQLRSVEACSADEVQSTKMLAMSERRKATSLSSGVSREFKAAFRGTLR